MCERYSQPPDQWVFAELESKELLAYLLRRLRLNKVKLIDANFIWTEPHSKRLQLKLTVQAEVFNGAILEQSFVVVFVVNNNMCDDCHRVEAKLTWSAVAQVRQRVEHKKTFFWLEQVILKHQAHRDTLFIKETADGLDFFFHTLGKCRKFVDFISGVAPLRQATSKELVSYDEQNAVHHYKYTVSVELIPICKEDFVCLPRRQAQKHGNISQLVLCTKVTNSLYFVDPFTLQVAEINTHNYWKEPFYSLRQYGALVEYFVIDVNPIPNVTWRNYMLAEVEVCRASDASMSETFLTRTHLGNLLKPGDSALGYDLESANFNDSAYDAFVRQHGEPEVVLVRKHYPVRRRKIKTRAWKLKRLAMEYEDEEASGKRGDQHRRERTFEQFMRDLEEDEESRAQVNLYKDENNLELLRRQYEEAMAAQEQGVDDEEIEPDFPEVQLDSLLDDLTLEDAPMETEDVDME